MPRTRRRIALLSGMLLALTLVTPVAADDPAISTSGSEPDQVAPAGTQDCAIYASTLDGPLDPADPYFAIRAYEDFVLWGVDYPPNTTIIITFRQDAINEQYETTTDADGVFAEVFFFYPTGQAAVSWGVGAHDPGPLGCGDIGTIRVLPPNPFSDVTSHAFELEISWLYREGITGGCTSTKFCPGNGVTRGQMAAFLTRALHLPTTTVDFFDDDDGTAFEGEINRLANAGITGGCATRRFCQNAMVTREQMASFLARALSLPTTSTDRFTDDETSIHEASINRLAAAGITGGCTATTFCPRAQVTRGQMAAFLYRGLAE